MALSKHSDNGQPRATLIGTLIKGPECCDQVVGKSENLNDLDADPAVYTRVDRYLPWIKQVTGL